MGRAGAVITIKFNGMKNSEIIFKRVRELASNNGVKVLDVWETETEFICIDVDDDTVPYKYLIELDKYLYQWNMFVISVDINHLAFYDGGRIKRMNIWIG